MNHQAMEIAISELRAAVRIENDAREDYKRCGYDKNVEREYIHARNMRGLREQELIRVALCE